MQKLFVSVPQACDALGVGRSKFYELIGAGKISVRKLGKRTLVAVAELQRFADALPKMLPTDLQNRELPSDRVGGNVRM